MTDTAATGNWSSGGTWVGGVVPTTTTAVIKSPHTVTVTANATIGAGAEASIAIQVEQGATVLVNSGVTLTASGHVEVEGVLTLNAGGILDLPSVSEIPPIGHNLTIESTGVVNANGTSTSPCQIKDLYGFGSKIDGTGVLNATYTGFTKLYGHNPFLPGGEYPEGAGLTRWVPTAQWEYNMVTVGMALHNARVAAGFAVDDNRINSVYYDAAYCYYRILEYTGDAATWLPAARLAAEWQRWIFEASDPDGAVQAFYAHTKGLGEDFLVDGDTESKTAALNVSINSAYAGDGVDDSPSGGNTAYFTSNREAALTLHTYLVAKDLGQAQPRPRYDDLVEFLYGHWEQIAETEDWIGTTSDVQAWMYIGLAFRTLWWDWTTSADARFIPKLTQQVEYFWTHGWDETEETFLIDINPDTIHYDYPSPAPDVVLLVTPVLSFLWTQTWDTLWRDRYDMAFAAAVRKGYMGDGTYITGKQFNEKYIWSFQGEVWRAMEPEASSVSAFVAGIRKVGFVRR